jgi:tetratricopeptide (TPR) repeat protein
MAPENISHTNAANEAQKETSAIVEEDKGSLALLEEAELYAAYGHTQKAIVILEDFVIQYPDVEKGWILLLSIYSSRGQSEEFEKAARLFSLNNKNDHAWKMIQALGRTLDKTNPLYTSDSSPTILNTPLNSRNEHRPIGIILVDLGYLPLQDLELSLKGFDPDQHGRFGNHLVSRRQVSYAQLTEAVLAQQAHAMTLQPDTSITLQ